METIQHKFVVILREHMVTLVHKLNDPNSKQWCPISEVTTDVNHLIQQSESVKELNNAKTAIQFNLPFVIGDKLVIPISINDQGEKTIFGGQKLFDNVGE